MENAEEIVQQLVGRILQAEKRLVHLIEECVDEDNSFNPGWGKMGEDLQEVLQILVKGEW